MGSSVYPNVADKARQTMSLATARSLNVQPLAQGGMYVVPPYGGGKLL